MFKIPKRFAGIKRFEQILKVIAKYELGFYLEKIGVKNKSLFSRKRVTRPIELRMMFEELSGSFVKLGQLLSLRPDLIPVEYCEELSKLQDSVEPFSYAEVEHVIKAELKKPVKKLFRSFDKKPIASASIGQVHLARLKSGKKVAVKVMRPGIKALMEEDLEILDYLSRLFKHHIRQELVDPEEIFSEFKEYTENELDYMKEACNIQKFYRNFKNNPKVKIPRVYESLTTHRVLTMEFIEGVELKKVISHPDKFKTYNMKKISGLIVDSVMKQIFIDGFFHADPHPGNILIKEKSIGFIDFGIVGRLNDELKEKLEMMFISLMHRDSSALVKCFISLNLVDDDVDEASLKKDLAGVLGEYYDTSLDRINMVDLFFKSLRVARKHSIKLPKDFVLLGKALLTLQGVGIELNPGFNLVRETAPFLSKLVKQKKKPTYILRRLAMETERIAEFVRGLPDESQKVFRTLEKADVALDTINKDIKGLISELRVESWRIVMGIIIASLVIGASLTYKTDAWMGKGLIILACLILLYLMFSVFKEKKKY